MDLHSPNKIIATKYFFLILGDDTSVFFLIISFFFVFFFCYFTLLLIFTKIILLLLFIFIYFFHENDFYFFMFRDVPACSGMFQHVPECSVFLVLSTIQIFRLSNLIHIPLLKLSRSSPFYTYVPDFPIRHFVYDIILMSLNVLTISFVFLGVRGLAHSENDQCHFLVWAYREQCVHFKVRWICN